jgi:hypothetical protein
MKIALLLSISILSLASLMKPVAAAGLCLDCDTQVNSQAQSQTISNRNNNANLNDNDNDNSSSMSVYEEDEREVHSAYAPALSAGSDTCLGSTSAGAQGGIFGLSFGTNWTDQNCENIRSAKALYDMGEKQAALLVMCLANGGRNRIALEATGHDCSAVNGEAKETATVPAGQAGPVQLAEIEETRIVAVKIER